MSDAKSCEACRTTVRPDPLKKDLTTRLARIEGQVRGVAGMVGRDAYCDDVLAQVAAIRSALDKVALGLLEHHMKHCLVDRVRAGEDSIVDEVVASVARFVR